MKPIPVSYSEIMDATPWASLKEFAPEVVVGIERGGMVLAAIAAFRLGAELVTIRASLYDDSKPAKEKHGVPEITDGHLPSLKGRRVLIVDDVCNTGRTMSAVRKRIADTGASDIKTFVFAGKADFSCRPFEKCLRFPWEEVR